jgi:hypothetical protein
MCTYFRTEGVFKEIRKNEKLGEGQMRREEKNKLYDHQ